MPRILLAHSPDSDDAFMFYALATGAIPTGDRTYIHELADIETLNQRALKGELDVTAVSFHAYAYLADRYVLLSHGASMGEGYGPCVVSRSAPPADPRTALAGRRVAIPGRLTTAALALRLFQPAVETTALPFDRIEQAVASGEVDAGVLIHEGQLTYGTRGLKLWVDLGDWWCETTGLPLPLGGNVVRRDLGEPLIAAIARDLHASILYALEHRAAALAHAQQYARGLDRERTDRFVAMYVNRYTVDCGEHGRRAVQLLLDRAAEAGILPGPVRVEFAPPPTSQSLSPARPMG